MTHRAQSCGEVWRAIAPRMRWWVCAVVLVLSSVASYAQNTAANADSLDSLVLAKQYVELEESLKGAALNTAEGTYYNGLLANHLNRAQQSVDLLEAVLPALEASNPVRAEVAVCTLADDFVKLSKYADASETYAMAARIADSESHESLCHATRESARWALFRGAPAQVVVSGLPTIIRGTRDKLGLVHLPVMAGSYAGSWLLDTGANVTVIRRSAADRIGVQLSANAAAAQGSSGKSVGVHAGTIPELQIGKIVLRNVAVLVVEDADLNFPDADYQIEGSLGLPVLAALGRVTLYADGSVVLGAKATARAGASNHTLFFERSTPLVAADLGYGRQLFVVDTGAQGTILTSQFFAQTKGTSQLGKMVTLDLAGAGGVGTMAAFGSQDLVANFGGACVPLNEAHILTSNTGSEDDFYGVIGQDALRQVTSVTFDFVNMQFSTRGGGSCSPAPVAAPGK
jgi:hypothetical protein